MDFKIRPIVTEKANAIAEQTGRYSFRVSHGADKAQIKAMIEDLYGVKVVSINTMNYDGKKKQRWTKAGLLRGKMPAFKKAIVTLAEGQSIDFYSNI